MRDVIVKCVDFVFRHPTVSNLRYSLGKSLDLPGETNFVVGLARYSLTKEGIVSLIAAKGCESTALYEILGTGVPGKIQVVTDEQTREFWKTLAAIGDRPSFFSLPMVRSYTSTAIGHANGGVSHIRVVRSPQAGSRDYVLLDHLEAFFTQHGYIFD